VDTYWSNFVFFNNPNGNSTTARRGTLNSEEFWAPYDPIERMDMFLAVPTQSVTKRTHSVRDFRFSVFAHRAMVSLVLIPIFRVFALVFARSIENDYVDQNCAMWDSIDAMNRVKLAAEMNAEAAPETIKVAPATKPKIVLTEQ
jgi:hypothetical protein